MSRFIVAVGASKCGKTMALASLVEKSRVKHVMCLPLSEGLRQNHVDSFVHKKKCSTIVIQSLLDVDARDTFTDLVYATIRDQKNEGKHVFQETQSFFEVPLALRQHITAVLVFKSANYDERRRIFRYFANEFFATREQFDEAVNTLDGFDCMLMDKQQKTLSAYNAVSGPKLLHLPLKEEEVKVEEKKEENVEEEKKDEKEKKVGYKKWFWSMLGY